MKSKVALFLLLLIGGTAGCQQRMSSKLLGRWEGRPDSASLRAQRESEKYGDVIPVAGASAGNTGTGNTDTGNTDTGNTDVGNKNIDKETVQVTDWEDYDVTIVMDFVSSARVEMSLDGASLLAENGAQLGSSVPAENSLPAENKSQSGSWQIVSQSPVGCTIEIQTSEQGEDNRVVRRRFDLLLDERDGTCVGFQLTENGADPQVGAIYFRRPES